MIPTLSIEELKQKFEQYNLHVRAPDKWDHTASGAFGECERLGYYAHGLGLVPVRENYAFTWGRVHHKITEIWNTVPRSEAVEQITATIAANIPEQVDDRYGRNRSRMMELFVTWADFCEKNPIRILHNEQKVVVVCKDSCPYSSTGCDLAYGGRIDVIGEERGIVGPLDRKTSVMDDADPIAEYKPSHQMEGYVWQASHLIGEHCWGVILEKAVCNKSKLFVKRYPISYSKDLIREWAENERRRQLRLTAKFASDDAYRMEAWEQNHFRCYKPFRCAYADICTAPRDMDFRFKLMRDRYVEARWDFMDPDTRDEIVAEAAANQ